MPFELEYVCSPALAQFVQDKGRAYGPILAGALFGAGWFFWLDAVVSSPVKIPFGQHAHLKPSQPAIIPFYYLKLPRTINKLAHGQLTVADCEMFAYVPGLIATLALIMISAVSRSDMGSDGFDDHAAIRARIWLFISYVVSFGAILGSVWILIANYGHKSKTLPSETAWPGVAGILQVTCILGSGLTFFVSRGSSSEGDYGGYTGF